MSEKKTVMLTGASGTMGHAGFRELYARRDKFNIVLLLRGSEKNRKMFAAYENDPSVRIVWGDLLKYDTVLDAINGADYVMHVGGMVSPAADWKPYLTRKTNIGAAENICRAVKAQPDPDRVKVCFIGTVAETGDRNYPIHWARTGDPLKVSVYDHYAVSKCIAERVFVESGLKNWVVLRQSGILYPAILKNMDPIIFHVPLNGVLEWCTVEDGGRLVAKLPEEDMKGNLGPEFWNEFYNIGSGKEYRLTNFEFEDLLLSTLGLPGPKALFEPNWFILKNFHGQFYADGDVLENYLHFRENMPVKAYFRRLSEDVEFYFKIPRYLPKGLIALFAKPFMKSIASTPFFGTLDWARTNNQVRISAYCGSKEEWERVPSNWDDFELIKFDKDTSAAEQFKLDHGYDESKPEAELDLGDMKQAAKFRGGECLSESMTKGDMATKLKWKCGYCGAEFEASPKLILKGGHWCPECYIPHKAWDYDAIAKTNPFFAQVWYPNHRKDEHNRYDFDELFHIDGVKWDDIDKKKLKKKKK